ncbi:hypothetical protein [Saccharothrix sp. ST-888]|uniref:hypothetical protein n=1 Tax=Saccharothrix sp. ST-888 TaxID=1427391 RepID=UPI0005ED2E82|nr:hypothetical protein [Saccharothrix sp. ST-888]KJK56507.1 hypothetical protein UK12_22265 [Saccharothrix sp. ST-888]
MLRNILTAAAALAVAAAAAPVAIAQTPADYHLSVVRIDPNPITPGGSTTVHAFIANTGPDTTDVPFTVTVTLPDGVTATGPYFPDNCRANGSASRVRCTFPAGLPALATATALVPVTASTLITRSASLQGLVSVQSAHDHHPGDTASPFTVTVTD